MLKNYLKIALRNLDRQKGFSFINIFGLAIGIACCLLIFLYVTDELSYDKHHAKADRIHRVAKQRIAGGNEFNSVWSQVPMGPAIEENFAEVDEAIRFWNAFEPLLGYENQYFKESHFYFTDSEVLDVFTFPLIQGDPETALNQPRSVIITESTAQKYFGEEDPLGKVISYDGYPAGEEEMTVTGVMENLPSNSQFQFDFLASMVGVETEQDNWGSHKPIWTYVLLNEDASKSSLEQKLPEYLDAQTSSSAVTNEVRLEPLKSVHLYSDFRGGFKPGGSITYVYLFSAIGLFILLIACINFINLSTARSLKRAAEVGVRKTLGAQRSELVKQFLGEAFVITFFALICGAFLAELALPVMNELAAKELSLNFFADPYLLPAMVGLLLLVGLAAGLYPALFLSGFKPVRVLGNRISAETSGGNLRKGLVVFQFAVSIVLIVVTLTVHNQMDYVREKNLGFDKEQVVVLPYTGNADVLMDRFRQNPDITNASVSQRVPVNTINTDGRTVTLPDKTEPIRVESYLIDENFVDTYKLNIVAGRNISDELASDSSAFIINETAVTEFGWSNPQEALGKSLTWSGYKSGTIIGVVNDFHMTSLHEQIKPMVMHTIPSEQWWKTFISVRLKPGNVSETLSYLESNWNEVTPAGAYNYFFIDQSIQQLHNADQRTGRVFTYFAGLAILIACLGLFGLASYMTIKREKEVGIRKVFGANVANIVVLLSKDFIRLVGIGFIIAAPIAYLAMSRWLQNFAYHAEIGLGIFVSAGLIALAVSMLSVSYQSAKAALMNPVKSIRSE